MPLGNLSDCASEQDTPIREKAVAQSSVRTLKKTLNRAASKIFARAEKGESGNPRPAAETEACAGGLHQMVTDQPEPLTKMPSRCVPSTNASSS